MGDAGRYEALIEELGDQAASRLGYPNFLLKIRGQLKQYAAEYGLTPSSRSAVKAKKPKDAAAARRTKYFGIVSGADRGEHGESPV